MFPHRMMNCFCLSTCQGEQFKFPSSLQITIVDIFPFVGELVKQMRISFQQQGVGGNLSTLVSNEKVLSANTYFNNISPLLLPAFYVYLISPIVLGLVPHNLYYFWKHRRKAGNTNWKWGFPIICWHFFKLSYKSHCTYRKWRTLWRSFRGQWRGKSLRIRLLRR